MNPYERVMAVLSGEKPDRVPVMPWVRDWAAVQAGFGIVDIMENVEKHVFSQYYARKKFDYDAVFDLWGINAESEAMGTINKYDQETPPMAVDHPVKDYDQDLPRLKIPDPQRDGRLPRVLEGVRRLKEICLGQIPVVGYLQGPLRHATMLRGFEPLMRDIYKKPGPLAELLTMATDSLIVYGEALMAAGADIIMIGDPASSGDAISKKHWEKWSLPGTTRLVKAMKKIGSKVILHICGDISDRLLALKQTGIDCLSVDEKIDLGYARQVMGDDFCLFGNLSPSSVLFFGRPEEVEAEARKCIEKAGRGLPFILSSGCVVPMSVPPENIAAMVSAAQKYGTI